MTVAFSIIQVRLTPMKLSLANCGEGSFIMNFYLLFYFLCVVLPVVSWNWSLDKLDAALCCGSDWGLGEPRRKLWGLNCCLWASSCSPEEVLRDPAPFTLSAWLWFIVSHSSPSLRKWQVTIGMFWGSAAVCTVLSTWPEGLTAI